MPETMYRASRYYRVLGNPTAYLIVKRLADGRRSPSGLAEDVNRTISTVSKTLRHLHQVDLVRYDTDGFTRQYCLKDKGILDILARTEKLADRMRKQRS